jgi:hypothetical protein
VAQQPAKPQNVKQPGWRWVQLSVRHEQPNVQFGAGTFAECQAEIARRQNHLVIGTGGTGLGSGGGWKLANGVVRGMDHLGEVAYYHKPGRRSEKIFYLIPPGAEMPRADRITAEQVEANIAAKKAAYANRIGAVIPAAPPAKPSKNGAKQSQAAPAKPSKAARAAAATAAGQAYEIKRRQPAVDPIAQADRDRLAKPATAPGGKPASSKVPIVPGKPASRKGRRPAGMVA